jgi:hypothetical protein
MRRVLVSGAVVAAVLLVPGEASGAVRGVTLTPLSTPFHNPIGIDDHQPSRSVVVSANAFTGRPHNFELVAQDGTRSPFSRVSGLRDEVKIATVRSGSCQGGFAAGELFTGTGVQGDIARISSNGSGVIDPWAQLAQEKGLLRGSLFQDRYCAFGGDLIAVTTKGGVWRIKSSGAATRLANIGTHLEGLTTVPRDSRRYGPWAGKIIAGAEDQTRIYSIDTSGAVQAFGLGVKPEDLDIVPPSENFFAIDYGRKRLTGAPASQFSDKVGDVIVTQENPGRLFDVRWTGTGFAVQTIGSGAHFEHVTFSGAGIQEIPRPGERPVCLNARGRAKGRRLGPGRLGRKRASQRRRLHVKRLKAARGIDAYCVIGGGLFKVGYPTKRLSRRLGRSLRRRTKRRAVLMLTSSKRFTVRRIRPGDSAKGLRKRLHRRRRLRIGRNLWVLARARSATAVYRVRKGRVLEVGIATKRLVRGRRATRRLLRAWRRPGGGLSVPVSRGGL